MRYVTQSVFYERICNLGHVIWLSHISLPLTLHETNHFTNGWKQRHHIASSSQLVWHMLSFFSAKRTIKHQVMRYVTQTVIYSFISNREHLCLWESMTISHVDCYIWNCSTLKCQANITWMSCMIWHMLEYRYLTYWSMKYKSVSYMEIWWWYINFSIELKPHLSVLWNTYTQFKCLSR